MKRFPDEGWVGTAVRLLRFPFRLLAAGVAIVASFGPFMDGFGLGFAVLGGLAGTVLGEVLGASRARSVPLVGVAVAAWAALGLGYSVIVGSALFASIVGPATALWLGNTLAFTGGLFVGGAALRAASLRHPAALYGELGLLVFALTSVFASHRNGTVARPLWLSDAAWGYGIDPSVPLVAIGVALALGCAFYALLETRDRLPRISWALLPLIVVWAAWLSGREEEVPPRVPKIVADSQGLPPPPAGAGGDGVADATPGDDGEPTDAKPDGGEAPADAKPEDGDGPQGGKEPSGGVTPADGEQPAKPEASPDGQPVEPQDPGDSPASGDTDADGDGGAAKKPPDVDDPSKDNDGGGGGNPTMAVISLDDDYEPPDGYFYLRQDALSVYDGHRLVPATHPGQDADVLRAFPVSMHLAADPLPTPHQRLVHHRVGLVAPHPQPFGLVDPSSYSALPNPSPGRFLRAYAATSLAPTWKLEDLLGHTAGGADWTPEVRSTYLEFPTDPRYAALANRLVDELPAESRDDPFAKALVIKRYLDENMKYTRKARHADAPDPVADFLFGDFKGYCVHSSHAAVYLWRAAGIPSRVGTGYSVDAADRRGSTLLVRASDAHAWPELYLEGAGWVIADVTPKETLDPPVSPIDDDSASLLGDMLRKTPEPKEPIDWKPLQELVEKALIGVTLVVATAALLLHWAWRGARQLRPVFASRRELPRVGYRAALDRLVEAGLVRGPTESREAFARRVGLPSFGKITELHLAGRLGADDAKRPAFDRKRWLAALRCLHNELPGRARGWRRLLGALDPAVPWRAR